MRFMTLSPTKPVFLGKDGHGYDNWIYRKRQIIKQIPTKVPGTLSYCYFY